MSAVFTASPFLSPSLLVLFIWHFIPLTNACYLAVVTYRETQSVKHGLVSQSFVLSEVKDTNKPVRRSGDF